ncbi:Hypothetical predicted protein, partial [Paramuricea clavata]
TPSSSSNSKKTPPPTAATNVVATNAVAVKIPPFWPSDPELWFAQVKAQFSVKNMISQGTKFAHIVAASSTKAATEVRDLILTPPSTNPFDVLKATLTERVSLSKRRKIQQLLQAEELGDPKSSQLLRRLQQLHALMADGKIELTDAHPSIAQIQTPESAEISSIRSDLNKVLTLLDTGARKLAADPKLVKEGLCWCFLRYIRVLVDVANSCLVDAATSMIVPAQTSPFRSLSLNRISLAKPTNGFDTIFAEFPAVCKLRITDPAVNHNVQHHIIAAGPPTFAKAGRLSPEKFAAAKTEFDQMLSSHTVCKSSNNWASPLHVVPKSNGDWRPCGDYRALNAATKPDRYPVPHAQDFSARLAGCKIFSKIDLVRAYLKISVAPEDVSKTAVITQFGLLEFKRMPYGLRNAAQTFQRFMDEVCRDLEFVFVFIDDILVFSTTPDQHRHHLRQLFQRLEHYGLVINPKKCELGRAQLSFLGHHVSAQGISPLSSRIQAVAEFPQPVDKKKLHPLHKLLSSTNFIWSPECEETFQFCKSALASATLLVHPHYNAPTSITSDASDLAVGAVLEQFIDHEWRSIGFFSRKLQRAKTRYSTFDRELLGVYLAIRHFRWFIKDRVFHVYTDHKPLTFAISSGSTQRSPRQIRQLA